MRIILDIPILLSDAVFAMTGEKCKEYADVTVFSISTDSRECEIGDLFFSLAKERDTRIEHALDAEFNGAYAVCDDPRFINVKSTERALLLFAELYKSRMPRLTFTVGITGSVGKSTATRYTAKLLSNSYKVAKTVGNFNNRIGVSLSILSAERSTEILVLEIGMNHRGEIAEIANLIRPDICVITNVGSAHIGNLGCREAIAASKREIITEMAEAVIVPEEEPLLKNVKRRISLSLSDCNADMLLKKRADGYSLFLGGRVIDGLLPNIRGEHNLYNLLIAAAVANFVGISESNIKRGINSFYDGFTDGRIIECGRFTVIDDSYNSSPEAVMAMLDYVMTLPTKRYALISDMLELGEKSGALHYAIGKRASGLCGLYIVGEYADYVALGAIDGGMPPEAVKIIRDTSHERLCDLLTEDITEGTLLIKGSHATGLSEVVKILRERTKKG